MPEPARPAGHPAGCGCHHGGSAAAQSLAEVAFLKSAARAAKRATWPGSSSSWAAGQTPSTTMGREVWTLLKFDDVRPARTTCDRQFGCFTSGTTGYTPLLYAARAGHYECVEYLLDKGCGVCVHFLATSNTF